MPDIIQLKESSYKGVSFPVKEMPTDGGRRVIKIRYPRSDKQSIEDQGLIPREFSITAIIPHDDYYNVKDSLLRVLEDGEKGTLVHPTFGNIESVRNGTYSLEEKITELGKAEILIKFFIDDAVGVPVESARIASRVQTASDVFNASLASDMSAAFEITSTNTGNFADAKDAALNVPFSFSDISKGIQASADKIDEFNGLIVSYQNNVGKIVQDPVDMAAKNNELFNSLNNLYENSDDTYQIMSGLFGFGDDDPSFEQNTAARIERQQNRELIRSNMKGQALSYSYVLAVQIEFTNEVDLNNSLVALEDQYTDIRDNQLLSNESLLAMDDVRVQASAAFAEKLLNTRKVITINTRKMPLSVLVYQYYGSTELVPTIANLNKIRNNAFVEGDVEILSA
jgi:prophage DNA circulation protein